ncbi:MAG: histone deacetylase family protein [Candidatus Latescibacteria bacterium]|nr:histone deacetylase family protein [Candidatus Latescibacterota bacterium]
MKIIYSDTHRQHDPPYEFTGGGMSPYSEAPARADAILRTLREGGARDVEAPGSYALDAILAVHDAGYLHYLEHIYAAWVASGKPLSGVIPDAFAVRTMGGRPGELRHRDGYYCFDAQTPVVAGTYGAALSSAHCALTGADLLLSGERAAYALCRPPGHHAARDLYGGYCYMNNAAIAAEYLTQADKVAVLDVDYHHGNGTQEIFYESDRVLFISIHADPNRAYPFFSGFPEERGMGRGRGFNHNLPLPAHAEEGRYLGVLDRAMEGIAGFGPGFLVISAGVDTFRDDPLGDFDLPLDAFSRIGGRLAGARLPTLFVQEGGYNVGMMGKCVANLLEGFEKT